MASQATNVYIPSSYQQQYFLSDLYSETKEDYTTVYMCCTHDYIEFWMQHADDVEYSSFLSVPCIMFPEQGIYNHYKHFFFRPCFSDTFWSIKSLHAINFNKTLLVHKSYFGVDIALEY